MPQPLTFIAKALRRFRRNRRGSAVVEFAMVAPMFIALLFAIIETAMVFYASQVLETATQGHSQHFAPVRARTGEALGEPGQIMTAIVRGSEPAGLLAEASRWRPNLSDSDAVILCSNPGK